MQKYLNGKLITVLIITALCFYLTIPTFHYFAVVIGMGDEPTPEQLDRRNELLQQSGLVKLGLDLQGGADFLLSIDSARLIRQKLENDAEGIRKELTRENDIDASVGIEGTEPALAIRVKVNEQRYVDLATDTLEDFLSRHPELEPNGPIKSALAGEGVLLTQTAAGTSSTTREAVDAAYEVLVRRVDQFGLTNPIVQRADMDRIRVQVPGESNPTRIREGLLKTASLEFRLLHPQHSSLISEFVEGGAAGLQYGVTGRIRKDLLEEVDSTVTPGAKVSRIKENIPNVPAGYVLRLGRETVRDPKTNLVDPSKTIDDLVYLVTSDVPLTGANLRRATAYTDMQSLEDPIVVNIEFDREGTEGFADITRDNTDRFFAIILDDAVFSAPRINEPILGGRARITGGFSQQEARDLSMVLKAGALPAPLKVIEENTIGASLGADSIRNSGISIALSAIIIIVAMIAIYSVCGFIAVIATGLNVLMVLAIFSTMGATLTLSGIGGILLTMGMSVDANILIYERLREEINAGKPLRAAINAAFDRAFAVILDSNITSILPALVLVLFEVVDGSMKGFWLSLSIGLIVNLYTGVFLTRTLIETWYTWKRALPVGSIYLVRKTNIAWMSMRKVGVGVSTSLTAICIIYLVTFGPNWGVEFTGGVLTTVEIKDTTNADREKLIDLLKGDFKDVRAIKVVNEDKWQVTVPIAKGADPAQSAQELATLREKVSGSLKEGFGDKATIVGLQSLDSTVGAEFTQVAILSLIITSIIILAYLALQFQFVFGVAGVVAIAHDVFLALGIFKLMGLTVSLDIVSALLIILGYSINDKIVIFDRIRENLRERRSADFRQIVDDSINETLSRTLMTGGLVMTTLIIMYFLVGAGLQDFALILLLGTVLGTYSSLFLAAPAVYMYLSRVGAGGIIPSAKAKAKVAYPKVNNTK